MKKLEINGVEIPAGEQTIIDLNVAQLPTRTKIDIPVHVYRSKEDGPTLLLMAGLHGDEINGVEIVRRIVDNDLHHVQKGTVICIPILNVFGFINFSREVPDGKDVNRSFPGHQNGSLASKVANELLTKIIPHIDYGIDFHTGGGQRKNHPQIRAVLNDDQNRYLANLFQAPFTINSNLIDHSLRWAANEVGKKILVFEGGESLRFHNNSILEGINGTFRVMQGLGMIENAPSQQNESIVIQNKTWLRCLDAGIWIHKCKEGSFVEKGQLLGYTSSPYGDFKSEIFAPKDGYIIGLNYSPVVNKGDALIHIGYREE